MIRKSPPSEHQGSIGIEDSKLGVADTHVATIARGIISQPTDHTPLLSGRDVSNPRRSTAYSSIEDIEGQGESLEPNANGKRDANVRAKRQVGRACAWLVNPGSWNKQAIWTYGVQQPVSYVPAVVLGLLLNVLDALSYGTYITRFLGGDGCL